MKRLVLVLILAAASGLGQQRPPDAAALIRGTILDPSGAVIQGAKIRLSPGTAESITSSTGEFEFKVAEPGIYTLQVTQPGFAPGQRTIRISQDRAPERVRIVLALANVQETVEVSSADPGAIAGLDADHGAGTLVLNEPQLKALPDDPDAFSDQLQLFAASAGAVPGQAVVTVDGFLNSGRLPPKSAIAQVRINPDLYSAEYNQPPYEGGRIEIRTKPGAQDFHGSASVFWNGSVVNARDAFAPVRPPSNSTRWAFDLGGPIRRGKSGFFIGLEKRDNDFFSVVNAVTLDSALNPFPYRINVPAPQRLWTGTARVDTQLNSANSLTLALDFTHDGIHNAGVGGFVLPSAAYDSSTQQARLRLTETDTLSTRVVLDSRLALTWDSAQQRPLSTAPAVFVPGAMLAGGSVAGNLDQRIGSLEYGSTMIVSANAHTFKLGAELFRFATRETTFNNFNGSFLFGGEQLPSGGYLSGIDQYRAVLQSLPGVAPTSYTSTIGNPYVSAVQWQGDAFAQDDWKISPRLSVSTGLRYEMQTMPMDRGNVAPRVGIVYALDSNRRWIVRIRTGLFYTRINNATALEVRRLSEGEQTQLLTYSPNFSNPLTNSIPNNRFFQSDIRMPRSWQSQAALEHTFGRGWSVTTNYSWTTGWSLLRTRNINAPVVAPGSDPLEDPRPFGLAANLLEMESSGRFAGPVAYAGVSQQSRRRYSFFAGYVYQNFHTNADNPFFQPQSSYSDAGEWATPSWLSKHRAFGMGTVNLPWKVSLSNTLNIASGRPFNVTTGIDNNGDGSFNDRPGIVALTPAAILTKFGALSLGTVNGNLARNIGTSPATATVDTELSRSFTLHTSSPDRKQTVLFNIRATNLLNHTNVTALNGILLSPFFGLPNSAGPARRIEIGARFAF